MRMGPLGERFRAMRTLRCGRRPDPRCETPGQALLYSSAPRGARTAVSAESSGMPESILFVLTSQSASGLRTPFVSALEPTADLPPAPRQQLRESLAMLTPSLDCRPVGLPVVVPPGRSGGTRVADIHVVRYLARLGPAYAAKTKSALRVFVVGVRKAALSPFRQRRRRSSAISRRRPRSTAWRP